MTTDNSVEVLSAVFEGRRAVLSDLRYRARSSYDVREALISCTAYDTASDELRSQLCIAVAVVRVTTVPCVTVQRIEIAMSATLSRVGPAGQRLQPLLCPLLSATSNSWRGNRAKARETARGVTDDPTAVVFQYAGEKAKRRKRVYIWGSCLTGALGHDRLVRPRTGAQPRAAHAKPYKTPFAEVFKVEDVACGYGFTIFSALEDKVKSSHRVFGTGLNTDFQLGYQCVRKGHPLEVLTEPVPIALPLRSEATRIVKVACGRSHTVVLTDREGAFSLGNNAFGQCGYPAVPNEKRKNDSTVYRVEGIPDDVLDVACGQDHTLFLTSSGKVFSCGWGADGQLGLGNTLSQGVPRQVKGDLDGQKIVQLAGSVDCILAVSESGDLFGWGSSEYGQFGRQTDEKQVSEARHLGFPYGKVRFAASGATMCGVVNEAGDVYVWGYGLLGLGPEVSFRSSPTLLPRPLFGAGRFSPDVQVAQLYCGLGHFAAVTDKGDLYTWGKNRNGCLGLGHPLDQYFPFRVSITAEVLKVSCGVDHMAALCRSYC